MQVKKWFYRQLYRRKNGSIFLVVAGEFMLLFLLLIRQEGIQKGMENDVDLLLPELFVVSDREYTEANREEYISCTYTMTNTKRKYCFSGVGGEIKGRGNSTWDEFEKKPYKIKLDKQKDILGMGADRDWVLLSNPFDHTMLRNEIAFGIADILNMEYTSQSQWCHLYWNEEYLGIYQLCESVKVGTNRVNIEKKDTSGKNYIGYFVEIGGGVEGAGFEPAGRDNDWGTYCAVEVLYTGGTEADQEAQIANAYTYLQWVNSVILNKDWQGINALVDVDSFVNWYLTNEIMMNTDMGWSMFAYIPEDNKLYLGPVWDFDQSCGLSTFSGTGVEGWIPCASIRNAWFESLIEMKEFQELVYLKWTENREEIETFLQMEEEKAAYYKNDIDLNFERWDVLGEGIWRMTDEAAGLETYEENTTYLFDWLERRINWVDTEVQTYISV